MLDHQIEKEAARKETIIRDYLTNNIKENAVAIRGIGCIFGIEVDSGERAAAITKTCFENGLIIERAGRQNRVIKLMPALTIPDELLIKGMDIIKHAMC